MGINITSKTNGTVFMVLSGAGSATKSQKNCPEILRGESEIRFDPSAMEARLGHAHCLFAQDVIRLWSCEKE